MAEKTTAARVGRRRGGTTTLRPRKKAGRKAQAQAPKVQDSKAPAAPDKQEG